MTAAIARKHDAETQTFECTACGSLKARADFSRHKTALYGLNPTCRACDRVRHQKRWAETREVQRAKRAALNPTAVKPKPTPEQRPLYKAGAKPTTPDSVRYRSANKIVYPKDDPALCVFPGMPCEAQEGFALAHELFAANTCMGCVRGYFSTVGKEATGLVFPRFARKASADLWNSMVRSRYGLIDERRSA